jgi:TonB family protein
MLKDTRMSKTHFIATVAAGVAILAAAFCLILGTLPLMAAPQTVNDAPGVTVDLRGAAILHRSTVPYPAAALQQKIQGTLAVEVKIDSKGSVADARVLSGPDEFRKATLESVLQWHFASDSAGTTRVVQIAFELPTQADVAMVRSAVAGVVGGVSTGVQTGVQRGVIGGVGGVAGGVPAVPSANPMAADSCTIKTISVLGLPDQAKADLLAKLPVHEGDACSETSKINQAVRDYDEHLQIRMRSTASDLQVEIVAPGAVPQRIKVGGNVQAAMVIRKVQPIYPADAKAGRVSGTVQLAVVIGKDGTIQEIHSLGGPASLVQSAFDAVKQWVYRPTLLNGQPVEVETTVDVNYTLIQ